MYFGDRSQHFIYTAVCQLSHMETSTTYAFWRRGLVEVLDKL